MALQTSNKHEMSFYFHCPNCKRPSCGYSYSHIRHGAADLVRTNDSLASLGYNIDEIWPTPPTPNVPEHVPENVRRVLLQAESNFFLEGHEEAAAVMYRKALESGLRSLAPELKGTLASRIAQLGANGKLTSDLVEWAKEIKNLGNDGAHEIERIERAEVSSMRGLTEMVLRYLFTLPQTILEMRKSSSLEQI